MRTLNNTIEQLERWQQQLQPYAQDFPSAWEGLVTLLRDTKQAAQRLSLGSTPLSIGIVGQIKAGKSTFLNGLLFAGQKLLPTAATPKTANLTRIHHASHPQLTVHYYQPDDWLKLERLADSDDGSSQARVARELVQQARKNTSKISETLAHRTQIFQAASLDELQPILNDYVGNDGRFAPLVESTELGLPLAELEGVEVVDTPGLNDPVISRTQKTRDYLASCDVVFLLSRCSQFFDESDRMLIDAQLPDKGVKRMILVGSQFDGAILDDGFGKASYGVTRSNVTQRLTHRARTVLEQIAARHAHQEDKMLAERLREAAKHPIFMSSYAHVIAHTAQEKLPSEVAHVLRQFHELAQDEWQGNTLNQQDWGEMANFAALHTAFSEARHDKEALLAARRDEFASDKQRACKVITLNLRQRVLERMRVLQTTDLVDLDARRKTYTERIRAISQALEQPLREAADKMGATERTVNGRLQREAAEVRNLPKRTGVETRTRHVKISDSKWYNPFSWGTSHTESYQESTSYRYIAIVDVIERLRDFINTAKGDVECQFDRLISASELSAQLRRTLLDVLDTRGEDLDARGLHTLLQDSVMRIEWPLLSIDIGDPTRILAQRFSDEVRSSNDMNQLEKMSDEIASDCLNLLANALHAAAKTLADALANVQNNLLQRLTADMNAELDQIASALADRNNQLQRYQRLIDILKM